jgi:ABC-type enterochelin transport system ATPase subunit
MRGKRLLGRSRRRCNDKIEMYLEGMLLEDVVWMDVAQGKGKKQRIFVSMVMNSRSGPREVERHI